MFDYWYYISYASEVFHCPLNIDMDARTSWSKFQINTTEVIPDYAWITSKESANRCNKTSDKMLMHAVLVLWVGYLLAKFLLIFSTLRLIVVKSSFEMDWSCLNLVHIFIVHSTVTNSLFWPRRPPNCLDTFSSRKSIITFVTKVHCAWCMSLPAKYNG